MATLKTGAPVITHRIQVVGVIAVSWCTVFPVVTTTMGTVFRGISKLAKIQTFRHRKLYHCVQFDSTVIVNLK